MKLLAHPVGKLAVGSDSRANSVPSTATLSDGQTQESFAEVLKFQVSTAPEQGGLETRAGDKRSDPDDIVESTAESSEADEIVAHSLDVEGNFELLAAEGAESINTPEQDVSALLTRDLSENNAVPPEAAGVPDPTGSRSMKDGSAVLSGSEDYDEQLQSFGDPPFEQLGPYPGSSENRAENVTGSEPAVYPLGEALREGSAAGLDQLVSAVDVDPLVTDRAATALEVNQETRRLDVGPGPTPAASEATSSAGSLQTNGTVGRPNDGQVDASGTPTPPKTVAEQSVKPEAGGAKEQSVSDQTRSALYAAREGSLPPREPFSSSLLHVGDGLLGDELNLPRTGIRPMMAVPHSDAIVPDGRPDVAQMRSTGRSDLADSPNIETVTVAEKALQNTARAEPMSALSAPGLQTGMTIREGGEAVPQNSQTVQVLGTSRQLTVQGGEMTVEGSSDPETELQARPHKFKQTNHMASASVLSEQESGTRSAMEMLSARAPKPVDTTANLERLTSDLAGVNVSAPAAQNASPAAMDRTTWSSAGGLGPAGAQAEAAYTVKQVTALSQENAVRPTKTSPRNDTDDGIQVRVTSTGAPQYSVLPDRTIATNAPPRSETLLGRVTPGNGVDGSELGRLLGAQVSGEGGDMRAVTEIQSASRTVGDPVPARHMPAHHVTRQVMEAIQHRGSLRAVELQLNPIELGKVRINMQSVDNTMIVHVTADRPETIDLLRRNVEMLSADLRQIGYDSTKFSFADSGASLGDRSGADQRARAFGPSATDPHRENTEPEPGPDRPAALVLGERIDIRI